ncbi:Hydrogenase expression/formation protein HupE [Candidatus Magnetomoraceae bacterium gMMP-1]
MKLNNILLDHGSGGKISHKLISEVMLPLFDNPILAQLNDGAIIEIEKKRLCFSTDTFTVDPLFFPGGSIGELAVNGTVNDVSMCGACPLYLSAGLIIEEGFALSDLKQILKDMSVAAKKAGVMIVTGDTKVVPKGGVDKIFINTSGIGLIPQGIDIAANKAKPGDKIILSGSIADHGITILTQREQIGLDTQIKSDTAPLNSMVKKMISKSKHIHVFRDPTRGGLGTTLNEIAISSEVGIKIYEEKILIKNEVAAICELLGFDPLYVANEGKLLAFVRPDHSEIILDVMKQHKYGRDACIIGEVIANPPAQVYMETSIGGTRIIDMLSGEQLPRIC